MPRPYPWTLVDLVVFVAGLAPHRHGLAMSLPPTERTELAGSVRSDPSYCWSTMVPVLKDPSPGRAIQPIDALYPTAVGVATAGSHASTLALRSSTTAASSVAQSRRLHVTQNQFAKSPAGKLRERRTSAAPRIGRAY